MTLRVLLLTVSTCAVFGCQSGSGNPSRPTAADAPVGPVHYTSLVVTGGEFYDTDGNGYRDSTEAGLYLFSESVDRRGPVAVRSPGGSVLIRLLDDQNNPIAEWSFTAQQLEDHYDPSTWLGPGYPGLLLDINAVASDRVARTTGLLTCVYITPQGKKIPSRGPAVVAIGPISPPR